MEAIGNAGAAIACLAKDGVVLIAEKKITSKARARTHTPPALAARAPLRARAS